MNKKLGVLVHGAGWVSRQHIVGFQNCPYTRVVAVSSRRLESARKCTEETGLKDVAIYDDYEKALSHHGVDIVSICTPQHLHAQHTITAAKAGKHIAIEKPLGNSLREIAEMRNAVRKAKVKTVVCFQQRFNPLFQTIKALIADDAIGKMYYLETDYQANISGWWSGWEDARKKSTGVSASLVAGCHGIDAFRWLAGPSLDKAGKAVEVFAYAGGYRKGLTRQYNFVKHQWEEMPPIEYDDFEIALVKFDNGVLGKVSVNFGAIMPYGFPVEIFGDKGTIKDNRVFSHKFPGQKDWVTIPTIQPDTVDIGQQPFKALMCHFAKCVMEDRESHVNLEDAINTHEIAFAALECYETRKPVKLPLID